MRPVAAGDALLRQDPGVRRHLRRASVLAVPVAALTVAQAFALAAMVVALAQNGTFDARAAGVLVGAAAGRGLLSWWLERSGRLAAAAAIGRLRAKLVTDAATLAAAAPGALRPGEIAADVVHQLPSIESYVGRFLSGRPAAAATTVVVLAAVASTDLLSAALLAPTVPILIVFLWLVGTEARDAADARLASLQLLGAHLLDVLRGLTDLRAFGRAEHQRGQVGKAAAAYRVQTMGTLRAAFLSGLVLELVAMLGTALVAVFGGVRLAGGDADLAAILPALVLAPELYAPLRRLGAGYHEAADAKAALGRLAAVADQAAAAPVAGKPAGVPAPRPNGCSIVLEGVSVAGGLHASVGGGDAAAPRRADRLTDVSLTIAPGETVALVGPSGAGKSTLAAVVLGLLPPTNGTIRAGGIDLATRDLATWHRGCAWLAQDPVLLPATLRENARLAAPNASDAGIYDALFDAGLGTLFAALPDGLDTLLGEGGAQLSSGELRRLALVRALLSDADLIVLDEPTAQLDALTAGRLQHTIDALTAGRTTLLITHDAALAHGADRIVELRDGRVARVIDGIAAPLGPRPAAVRRAASAAVAIDTVDAAGAGLGAGTNRGLVISVASSASAAEAEAEAEFEFESGNGSGGGLSLRAALRLLRPDRTSAARRLARRAIGLGTLSALSAVAVLALSGALIVEASTRPPVLELTAMIVLVRMFSILRATGRYGERLAGHDAALRILEGARVRVFGHFSGQQDRPAAALDRAVGDVDRTADLLVRVLVPGVAAILTVLVASAIAVVFSVAGAAAIAGVALVTAVVVARAGMQAGRAQALAGRDRAALASDVVTALDAGTELLLAGRAAEQAGRVAERSDRIEHASALHGARGAAIGAGLAIASALTAVLVAVAIAPAVSGGALSGAVAAGLVLAGLAAIERLDGIGDAALSLPSATTAVGRIAAALRADSRVDADGRAPLEILPSDGLEVREIHLRRGSRAVLEGASLRVARGEHVVITGESGCGKSSLLLALAGLLPVEAGSARLDSLDLLGAGDAERAAQVLLVPSRPHLFGGSLAANLRLAAPEASEAELRASLEAVGLGPWVDALPHGLETQLGERGVTASGGQRQRLGLARAHLSSAPVLLLDEPASHLPEAAALAALEAVISARPGRTVVLVSHRAAEHRLAARELRMERGRLAPVTRGVESPGRVAVPQPAAG